MGNAAESVSAQPPPPSSRPAPGFQAADRSQVRKGGGGGLDLGRRGLGAWGLRGSKAACRGGPAQARPAQARELALNLCAMTAPHSQLAEPTPHIPAPRGQGSSSLSPRLSPPPAESTQPPCRTRKWEYPPASRPLDLACSEARGDPPHPATNRPLTLAPLPTVSTWRVSVDARLSLHRL